MFSVVDVLAPFLLYLAVATELGQTLVVARTLDVTDLMIQAAGAAIGWVAVRRAGFLPYGAQLRSGSGP